VASCAERIAKITTTIVIRNDSQARNNKRSQSFNGAKIGTNVLERRSAPADSADFYNAEFKPAFRSRDELVWVDGETSVAYSTEELAAYLITLFVQHVEEVISDAR